MKLICLALATFSVGAVPLSKASLTDKSECCVVGPNTPADDDGCRCFGNFMPEKEHQQCMAASPQYENEQLKRAWQAGCWCIDETKTCQEHCEYSNDEIIRVLYVDWETGKNNWETTTVKDSVAQPPNVLDRDARQECFSGCASRGFCSEELPIPWTTQVAGPSCDSLQIDNMGFDFAQGSDPACKNGNALAFGQKCSIVPKDDNWCRTNTLECGMDKLKPEDVMAVSYNFPTIDCPLITPAPTKEPTPMPTTKPTSDPTPMPTQKPTTQPIDNPTSSASNGCAAFNNLKSTCDVSDLGCGYSAATNECKVCQDWDGSKNTCQGSSTCGYKMATGQCVRCDVTADETICAGTTGCRWTGDTCQ